jgi:hypothetical protein
MEPIVNKMLEQTANHAIFQLQLNMDQAIKYVAKHANVNFGEAARAVNNTVIFHKIAKVN